MYDKEIYALKNKIIAHTQFIADLQDELKITKPAEQWLIQEEIRQHERTVRLSKIQLHHYTYDVYLPKNLDEIYYPPFKL